MAFKTEPIVRLNTPPDIYAAKAVIIYVRKIRAKHHSLFNAARLGNAQYSLGSLDKLRLEKLCR